MSSSCLETRSLVILSKYLQVHAAFWRLLPDSIRGCCEFLAKSRAADLWLWDNQKFRTGRMSNCSNGSRAPTSHTLAWQNTLRSENKLADFIFFYYFIIIAQPNLPTSLHHPTHHHLLIDQTSTTNISAHGHGPRNWNLTKGLPAWIFTWRNCWIFKHILV